MKQRWKQLNAAKAGEGEGEKGDESKAEEKKDEKEVEEKEEKNDEKKEDKKDEKDEKKDDKDEKKDEKAEEKQEEKKEEKKEEPPLKSALKTTKTETKADTAPKKLGDKSIIYMDKDDQCTTEDVSHMARGTPHANEADTHLYHGSILCSTSFMAGRRKTNGLRLPLASSTRLASVLTHSI